MRQTATQYLCPLVLRLILACASLAWLPAHADIVQLGKFCIEGVQKLPGALQPTEDQSEAWEFAYPNSLNRPAKIYIFEKPVARATWSADCTTLAKREVAAGNQIVLTGSLKRLELQTLKYVSAGQPVRWEVPPNNLDAEIVSVLSGKRPVMGGYVDFAGSKAWLSNRSSDLHITDDAMSGEIDIETWARTIHGVFAPTKIDQLIEAMPT